VKHASDVAACACTGCGAPHHRTGAEATARWYLDLPARPRETVCGSCANRRTASASRTQYLTPIAGQRSTFVRLAGKVVGGLEISSVPAEDGVVCECYDPDCTCSAPCTRPALYLWGGVEHDDWQYLCRTCCLRLVERGTAPELREEAAPDA
jgi:hypothetical protein